MRFTIFAFVLGLAALPAHGQSEQLPGDPVAGRVFAEDICSACHIVAPGQVATADVAAPAFADIAARPEITALSLRVFLKTPHERMPNLWLDRDEADDVIAYILTLDE